MKKSVRSPRRNHHRRTGKSPRWLMLGALAAGAALVPRPAAALADEAAAGRKEAAATEVRTRLGSARPGPSAASPARRFDIPAGPMAEVLQSFSAASGVRIEMAQPVIGALSSPGVSGLFTADQALAVLLAGTGVAFDFPDPLLARLELSGLAETLEVTAPLAPSSPKFTAPLRDTPQTLSVISQELIEAQGATTLRDVLRNVTGISLQAGEGGGGLPGDSLTIRGFAARNDVFVDGVRDFGAYSRDPFNVEQVEVAKGPASLYGGRGSTGGSLNLSSKAPQLEAADSATLGVGTGHYGRATADLNQPLSGLAGAALRVNAMWTSAEVPGRGPVENRRWGLAPSVALGLGTPTRFTVSYLRLDQDNLPEYGIPWVPATNVPLARYADKPAPVSFDNFYGLTGRDYEKTVTGLATAQVEHDWSDSLSLRTLVRHGETSRDSVITAPRFASDGGTAINRQIQSRDLDDAILASQTDLTARFATGALRHTLATGLELARETSENHARSGPAAPLADLFDPRPSDPYIGAITRTGARTESRAETAALYATDTVELGPHWQVTGGLRLDHFGVEFDSVAVDGVVTPFERTDRMLSWRAGAVYKPRPEGSVYVAAGTSFNPSSDGNTGLSLTTATVDLAPEKSRGYEVGSKWDFLGGRLAASGAVFRTEKVNARTPGVNPGDPPTVLAGEQRVDGAELGLTGRLTSRWSATFGYTFLDSEIRRSNTPAELGRELANTPRHTLSLWTSVRPWRGVELGFGAQHVGARFSSTANTRRAPAYELYEAMVGYEWNDHLTLRLHLNNLTDERYIDRVGGGHFIPGAARSAALTTSLRF